MRTTIDRDSVEYLHVPITTPGDVAPTGVELAVTTYAERPGGGDWETATWNSTTREAVLLVGPLTDPGVRSVWVRVVDSPETPVFNAGAVQVT